MRPKLPKSLEKAQIVIVNAKEGVEQFLEQFNAFLGAVQQAKLKRVEAKERELVGDVQAAEPEKAEE